MKKPLSIWLTVIAGIVLLSGMLISNSVVEKSADKTATITKVNHGCCGEQSDAVSNASYAGNKEASGTGCTYMSSCGSETADASSCDSKTNAAYTSNSSSKCTYKSASVQMAAEKSTEKDQPALTSAK